MNINILISTIDDGILNVHYLFLEPRIDVKYIISHQYTDDKFKKIPEALLERRDVIVSQLIGKGLSRNRNNAIRVADGDIAVIADDDIRYLPDSFNIIEKVFEEDKDLDVACFKIKTLVGEPEYKDYPGNAYRLEDDNHHYISSIEIAFRLNRIKEKQIYFDERFGIGAPVMMAGEESIFIYDCIENGFKVVFFPEYIVDHPYQSTMKNLHPFNVRKNILKGGIDARKNGWMAILRAFLYTIRFLPSLVTHRKNPLVYLHQRLKGIFHILNSKSEVND